jgi:hypothetical protein
MLASTPPPLLLLAGPPVNVALALEVASIDHISEVNMVGDRRSAPRVTCTESRMN